MTDLTLKINVAITKVPFLIISLAVLTSGLLFFSFSPVVPESSVRDVCVKVRDNGKSLVEVRVGPNNSSGACCTGISNHTTVTLCGKEGYNVYDSDTKRLLFTLSSSLEGKTVDLRSYY